VAPALCPAPPPTTVYKWAQLRVPRYISLHSIAHRAPGTGGPAASHSLARGPGRGTRLARQRRASRPGHRRHTRAIEVTTRAIEVELLASAGGRCWWLVEVVAVTVGERNAGRAANRKRGAQADPGIPGFLRPDFARNPSALSAHTLRPTGPRQPGLRSGRLRVVPIPLIPRPGR